MLKTETEISHLSADEFVERVSSLSEADKNRIHEMATWYSNACRFTAEDLLQEAITRTLEGIRKCPRNIGIVKFLKETMRSVASSEKKSIRRQNESSLTTMADESGSHQIDVPDSKLPPEELVPSDLEAKHKKDKILELFADDEIAQFIIEGWIAEMTPEELRDATGLKLTPYQSKVRKIRRKLNRYFPNGGSHD